MEFTFVSPAQTIVYGIVGAVAGVTTCTFVVHLIYKLCVARDRICWHDGLLWFGTCLALAINALTIYASYLGLGKQASALSLSQSQNILKVQFTTTALHIFALTTLKASLLLLYLRLFGNNKHLRWTSYFALSLLIVWLIPFSLVNILQCVPVSHFWSPELSNGYCLNDDSELAIGLAIADAVLNTTTDFLCLVAPWPVLWNLQLSTVKKTCLALIYFLGGCEVVITTIRLLYKVLYATNPAAQPTTFPALFQTLEIFLAVLCAVLPSLSPLLPSPTSPATTTTNTTITNPSSKTPKRKSLRGLNAKKLSFLQGFKRTPSSDWSVLTTVFSNEKDMSSSSSSSMAMRQSFDIEKGMPKIEDLASASGFGFLPIGIVVDFEYKQTVERKGC